MSPNMRKKLERNMEYHAALVDYHQGELDKKKSDTTAPASGDTKPTASASPPPPNPDKQMVDTHTEVIKQLKELLDKEPMVPAIVAAGQNRPAMRNLSGDLKPSAGVFH